MKSIKTIKIPKCKKCKGKLELRFSTEQEEGDKGKPKFIIVAGLCKKCKILYVLELIETKNIPSNTKEMESALKRKK